MKIRVFLLILAFAYPAFAQTNYKAAQSFNALPSNITTTDGQTYKNVKLLHVLADGLVVEYSPTPGGTGLAKLKFNKLSESLQRQFGYDQKKAAAYEKNQAASGAQSDAMHAQKGNIRDEIRYEMSHIPVEVKTSPPTVAYSYYDPAGPPPPHIHADGDWTGYAASAFECGARVACHPTQRGPGEPFHFHFDKIEVSLALENVITLPTDAGEKLKEHEEGHRKIAEYFYALGSQAAQLAGKTVTDDELLAYSTNTEAVTPDVITQTRIASILAEYNKHTEGLSAEANKYYDELTDHGKNDMDSEQAAQAAIRRYAPETSN